MKSPNDKRPAELRPRFAKPVIGLVGGIGSGKSLVAAELVKQGGYLIAGDELGHEALRQRDVIERIEAHWGAAVFAADGSVNRRRLGEHVFGDAAERKELESIVFPYIEQRIVEEGKRATESAAADFIVFDAAIMLEAGWNKICDWMVYVHCHRPLRLERLARSRGLTASQVEARENAQWPLLDKLLRTDDLIDNSGTAEQTRGRAKRLLRILRNDV